VASKDAWSAFGREKPKRPAPCRVCKGGGFDERKDGPNKPKSKERTTEEKQLMARKTGIPEESAEVCQRERKRHVVIESATKAQKA